MGGHEHGHHQGPPYVIPDYKIYKVEDAPILMETQRALAAKGLKDPWLRNEVWRFTQFGTEKQRFRGLFYRGFGIGFGALVVTIIGTEIWDRMHGGKDSHHHGEHH